MHKILFMGRKRVAADALHWLCQRDDVQVVAVITDNHLEISPTRVVAEKFGIEIMRRETLEERIDSGLLSYDLGISMLYWQKIRKPVIDLARKGVINFHPAPLPEYKGTAGYNIAILTGMSKWAVTSHYVDDNIDTGDIVDVDWFDIDEKKETAQTLEKKTQPILLEQFKRVITKAILSEDRLPGIPNIGGRYISRKEMESMKEIRPGDDVERKIRAFWFPPYDGAYVMLNGIKCTLVHSPILQSLADPSISNLFTAPLEE